MSVLQSFGIFNLLATWLPGYLATWLPTTWIHVEMGSFPVLWSVGLFGLENCQDCNRNTMQWVSTSCVSKMRQVW